MKKNSTNAEKYICSICGDEFEGYGNNAQPVNNGTCCDNCNKRVVLPIRINFWHIHSIKEKNRSEILEVVSNNGICFDYFKDIETLTDNKTFYIDKVSVENLNDATDKLGKLSCKLRFLYGDYDYLCRIYKGFNIN